MLNILVPMAGLNKIEGHDLPYPKALLEVAGTPLVERIIQHLQQIHQDKKFIFVVNQEDCSRFYIDNILKLLLKDAVTVVKVNRDTRGAACSALMAIDSINNEDELIIANSDSMVFADLNKILDFFRDLSADAGTICFESIHPKWSYVRLDADNNVLEAAEKKPISNSANAGFYYYKKGKYFVASAMKMIMKDASVSGNYFVAPTLNEMILENKRIKAFKTSKESYVNFLSMEKIREFDSKADFFMRGNV